MTMFLNCSIGILSELMVYKQKAAITVA
jgi:hypothetical protein